MSSRHQSLLTMVANLVCLTTLTAVPMALGASPENDCFYDALLLPDACTPGVLQATTGCDSDGCLPLIRYGHSDGMGSESGLPSPQSSPSTGFGQAPSAGFQPGGLQGGALMASSSVAAQSNVGYIDLAVPVTMFRLRYDAAFGNEFPDRAEFFYAKCGCAGGPGPGDPTIPTANDALNYQDVRATFEYAFSNRFSAFIEMPFRFIDPELNNPGILGAGAIPTGSTGGLGDIEAGFKYALIATPDEYFTFQLRVYTPTGNARRGLGTDHVSLEPALLYLNQLNDIWTLEGEFRGWIPVGGTEYAGEVLRYGVGLGCNIYESQNVRIAPVVEFVGWSVLDGLVTDLDPAALAGGSVSDAETTIVNGKFGVRIGFGPPATIGRRNQVYVGYGRAFTGARWYEDIFRLEYRMLF